MSKIAAAKFSRVHALIGIRLACRTGVIFFTYFIGEQMKARRARSARRARGEGARKHQKPQINQI